MKKNKAAIRKRAETIISKLVDLQSASGGDINLQDATRKVRYFIDNLK